VHIHRSVRLPLRDHRQRPPSRTRCDAGHYAGRFAPGGAILSGDPKRRYSCDYPCVAVGASMGRGIPATDPFSGGEHQVTRADYLAIALLLMALALGLSVAAHRLPSEMAYAAAIGDQRPPIPQVMPGTLASFGQSRFLPMPGASSSTITPDGAIRKDAQAGAIGCHCSRAAAADGPYGSRASGTNTCHAGRNKRPAISRFKAKRGAGEFRECK